MNNNPQEITLVPVSELEVMERVQYDMQIATAKKYPRDIVQVHKNILTYIENNPADAKKCYFVLPKGKDKKTGEPNFVEGPSVRLAELILTEYGNMRVATRVLEADENSVSAQAVVQDLEKNNAATKVSKRSIRDSEGRKYPLHLILTTGNAAAAIAKRDAIFDVVSKIFIDEAYRKAKDVAASGNIPERINKAFEIFAAAGVSEEKLLAKLGKKNKEDLTKDDLGNLVGFHNAIKDGSLKITDFLKEDPKPSARVKKDLETANIAAIPEEDI